MKRLLFSLLLLLLLAGCARKEEEGAAAMSAPAGKEAAAAKGGAQLAYEHFLTLDTEERKVAAVFAGAQAACRAAASELCTVLESRISTEREPSAMIKFRARPAGIRSIVAALGKQATVTNQSTSAEDLAQPIADAGKKLAMLKDYRAKLEALRERAGSDVDALIKVNRELAQVQSELESSAGEQAYLLQRVQTELLTVSIGSQEHQAFWTPVRQALAEFGDNLSRGIATAITATAFLLPWGALLLALLWLGRKLRLRPRWPWRRNGNT